MTVLVDINDWSSGSQVGASPTVLTLASPNIPASFVVNGAWAGRAAEPAAPWNGTALLDCTGGWTQGAYAALTASHMAATAGRFLVQTTIQTSSVSPVIEFHAATPNNFRLRARHIGATLQLQMIWNGAASESNDLSVAYPAAPYNIEVAYNTLGAANADRLKWRVWSVGGTAGALVATAAATTALASDQPTNVNIGSYNNGETWAKFGRVVISNDPTEDLAAYIAGGGGGGGSRTYASPSVRLGLRI